jgi:hypothetical protein
LEDLIATAERQLAARSYDAAVDTYRTALSEPGAVEAGVEKLLDAAYRTRDEARGIVRPVEPPAPPPAPPAVEMAAPPMELPAEPQFQPVPEPIRRAPAVDDRPIEPPAFHLIEDDPSILERPRPDRYVEMDVRSILNPTPAPEAADPAGTATRILIAMVIAIGVVLVAYYAK